MHDSERQDFALVEEGNLFSIHLTSYRAWCEVSKFNDSEESLDFLHKDVRPNAISAKRQWRNSLGRLSLKVAYSPVGLLAKGKALQDYFSEHPAGDIEARMLMTSFFAELDHFLENPEFSSCNASARA